MSDWLSFFRTDEFREYRKRQISKVAESIEQALYSIILGTSGAEDLKNMDGQLSMAKTLLKLPESMTDDKDLKVHLELQRAEDMAELTRILMRKRFEE